MGTRSEHAPRAYSAAQVAFAAFFGTPLAGALTVALNYRCLGKTTAYRVWLILAAFGIPFVVYGAALAPATPFDRAVPIISAVFFGSIVWFGQRASLEAFYKSGGQGASLSRLLGIVLFSLGIVVLLALTVAKQV